VLTDDPKRLKFFGIDLHSRKRRRIMVVFTYAVYLIAMTALETAFQDRGTHDGMWPLPGGFVEVILMYGVSFAMAFGIFRDNGPVKSFNERKSPFLTYGDRIVLETRDDWAKYLYDQSFDALPSDKQDDVRLRWRPGRSLAPYKHLFEPGFPDERELAEANRASRRALNIIALFLSITAARYATNLGRHPRADDLVVLFLEMTVAAVTLPKAVILWNEAAPDRDPHVEGVLPFGSKG
jgi:hypothetical protein